MSEFHVMLPQMRMTMDAIVARARAAEAAGFSGIAFMDHLAPPAAEDKPMYDAMATAAWVLANTERLIAGHLVLCDAFRHPAVLAREAVTLDHASNGRFELGIGAGSVPEEFESFGISPVDRRVSRFAETLEVLGLLWSGERVDYDGKFRHLHRAQQLPVPTRRIPIVIGGTGPRMMELVSRHADWWNLPSDKADRLEELRPLAKPARVSVQHIVGYVPAGGDRDEIAAVAQRRFGWLKDAALAFGTGPELVEHFARWRERGVERFYTWFTDFASLDTIAGFGADVIGAFRE
jgi:alkanesulfonate monooxygenase SsuD/methylene tetrahydromethanopterin reductase-like flavin-dependent oxidoreductase (luciferase family)